MSRLIPFNLLPASWGLRGKAFDVAKAHYELEGMELELRMAEIEKEGADQSRAINEINYRHGTISEYDWMKRHIEIETEGNPTELAVELMKLDMETGRITKREGEKQIANLLNEPWVGIVDEGLEPGMGPNGFYFEFDWNDRWIEDLRLANYTGTEEEIMEKWFTDVCREQVYGSGPLPLGTSVIYGD